MNIKLFLSIPIISLASSQCLAMSESPDEMLFRACDVDLEEPLNINLIKQALNEGANVDAQSVAGFTALHFAVVHNDLNAVKLLLNAGADINIKSDIFNDTPLEIARRMKHETIVKLLENWEDKKRKKIKEGTPLIPDLGDIVADYVVGPKKDVDKKEKSE